MKEQIDNNIFMTANWEDLIISTFKVDKELLEKYLPNNTELDLFNGKALMSSVAFTFSKVKFFGLKIPFHQKFGQINFRFYVKSKINGAKGVVFIKEFAPKPLIALTANLFYNEPYYYRNVRLKLNQTKTKRSIKYSYKTIDLKATVNDFTEQLPKNTLEDFVVDRYIAFVKSSKTKTFQYKINHKPWKRYKTTYTEINKNVISLLPTTFKNAKYLNTCVVDGSSVSVEKGILQHLVINTKTEAALI